MQFIKIIADWKELQNCSLKNKVLPGSCPYTSASWEKLTETFITDEIEELADLLMRNCEVITNQDSLSLMPLLQKVFKNRTNR